MTYKIRPEHKQLTSKNKYSKTYLEKKNDAVLDHASLSAVWWVIYKNILHRVAERDVEEGAPRSMRAF